MSETYNKRTQLHEPNQNQAIRMPESPFELEPILLLNDHGMGPVGWADRHSYQLYLLSLCILVVAFKGKLLLKKLWILK